MAGSAIRGEVFLARLQVASLKIGDVDTPTSALLTFRFRFRVMDKGHNGSHVHLCQIESRHAFLRTSIAHDIPDLVPLYVLRNKLRPGQIRSTLTATRIFAMAKPAVLSEYAFAV